MTNTPTAPMLGDSGEGADKPFHLTEPANKVGHDATTHTPGPWTLDVLPWPDDPFGFAVYSIRALPVAPESCGDAVTIFTDRPGRTNGFTPFPSSGTVVANARLIAAAPMLLEAAKEALEELYRVSPSMAAPKLRAAIASATTPLSK